MTSKPSAPDARNRTLSQALRAIRHARGLSALDVAQRMGLPRRSYAFFEAGGGRVNIDRIMAFAQATDSDPYAILVSVMIGAPELAPRASDNKLMTAFMILLQEFNAEVGDDIAQLETGAVIGAFSAAFRRLADAAAEQRRNASRDWLAERAPRLGKPDGGGKR